MRSLSFIILATVQAAESAKAPDFIGTLGLNWKLFLAQLLNFGIVVFILWKWVFRPVVGALESRRQKIEESVKKAEEIEKRMKDSEVERQKLFSQAREEAEALTKQAREVAEDLRQEITRNARQGAENILVEAKRTIAVEKEQMLGEVREEIANLTVMATEKILKDKLDQAKDKKLIQEVLENIK